MYDVTYQLRGPCGETDDMRKIRYTGDKSSTLVRVGRVSIKVTWENDKNEKKFTFR